MSCLGRLLNLVLTLLLVLGLVAGWLYRDELRTMVTFWRSRPATFARGPSVGAPSERGLRSATGKIDSLNGWSADSVLVTPGEMASLIGNGLDPRIRGRLDSLQVRLGEGELTVRARLETSAIPKEALGPLAGALHTREPVEASGPVRIVGPATAQWTVQTFRLRDFTFPRDVVRTMVNRVVPGTTDAAVPVRIPEGIHAVRIVPEAVILYGRPSRR